MRVHTATTIRDGKTTNREYHSSIPLQPLPPNPPISPPPSNRATYCSSGVIIPPPSHFNIQSMRTYFLSTQENSASHRARSGTPTVSLALGANREGKERVNKDKAGRTQSSRIGSALVCVRPNAQHRELKLPKSTRLALITAVMVAVPTGSLVSPPFLLSQNIHSHEESPESHRTQSVPPTIRLALGANRSDNKASRIQSSRIGSELVCVRRNAHHRELKLPESTQFVLGTVLMVAVSTCGPTGVSPPPLSSQNIQTHEK